MSLKQYQGKVLLIVNIASKCGFTPQLEQLEQLYQAHREKGFEVLGFPCDQFAHQSPENDQDFLTFCKINYGVSFPVFSKTLVNGKNQHPLFEYLKGQLGGVLGISTIKWNFTKFLVDREGRPVKRFSPQVSPLELSSEIEQLLAK
jgi:glutathione peroxidase